MEEEKIVVEGVGKETISPQKYRDGKAKLSAMYAKLRLGLVRIEPEGASAFYNVIKDLGIKVTTNKDIRVGKEGPESSAFKMDFDAEALMGKMDLVNMGRACGITREPVIYPTPKEEEERSSDRLYWDELDPIDRKTLVLALDLPEIGAQGGKFRSGKSGDDPDGHDE